MFLSQANSIIENKTSTRHQGKSKVIQIKTPWSSLQTQDPRSTKQYYEKGKTKEIGRWNMGIARVYQQAHPSRSLSRWMLIGSLNSPLNSSASSWASALRAITKY